MSLFSKIADALGIGKGDVRPQNVTYSEDVMEAFGVPASSGAVVTPVSAMRVAAVFACVQKIAGAIATLPIHAYRTDGDIKSRLPKDDLWYKLNEQPSTQFTAASHWEGVSIAQLLRGDAYTWIRRGVNNSIKELLPLPWGCVSPVRQPDGTVRYYIALPDYGIQTWLEPSEVLHFPGFGFDGIKSMSVISYAAKAAVGNAMAMDEYSGKFFADGAHPSIVLTAAGKMSSDQVTQLQNAFRNKYAGLDNAHRLPLVLTEGLQAKEISLSAEDAQLLEARKFQVIDIARAFGVPPHMIGETSASTSWGSGIESMSRGFVTYTLQPHLVRIEQELNRKLFPRDIGKFVQFDRDALIEGDSAAQAAYNRAALGGPGTGQGWMSVDEIRKTKGLAPIGGEASKIFDPREVQAPDTSKQDAAANDLANQLREIRHLQALHTAKIENKAPDIHFPEQVAPVVNVTFEPPHAPVINIPEQAAPVVNVTIEQPEAAIINNVVNVPESQITVEAVMPEQKAPVVNIAPSVTNVEVKPAEVNVNIPARKTDTTIIRDSAGNITKATQIERDA